MKQRNEAFRRVETLLGTSDQSKLPRPYRGMNREEAFLEGLEVGKVALEDGIEHNHNIFDPITPRYMIANSSPFGLHRLMFMPTIKYQGTTEQQAYWLPLVESFTINGAYCQTELGHGTYVRGIETTAVFDAQTDEFVVHSPTVTSTKFWPGGIGFSCSHAIVLARLIINTTDHGVHAFVMQFRSLKDYTPMPGIELGDLGLKMSYNGTCNGYATFDHVRIPRDHLLMGNAKVLRDGTYLPSPNTKLTFSTLIHVRFIIVRSVATQLAQAVTIAARYSAVREQGLGPNAQGSREVTIMTYKSQHYRILSLISKAYSILFASKTCDTHYDDLIVRRRRDDHSRLPFLHMLGAGMKAWATQTAADGAEDARKCCGGQGYLMMSGLPEIVAAVTATATFEGENYVMWQQVARYLLKCVASLKDGQEIDQGMAYLAVGYHERFSAPAKRKTALGAAQPKVMTSSTLKFSCPYSATVPCASCSRLEICSMLPVNKGRRWTPGTYI